MLKTNPQSPDKKPLDEGKRSSLPTSVSNFITRCKSCFKELSSPVTEPIKNYKERKKLEKKLQEFLNSELTKQKIDEIYNIFINSPEKEKIRHIFESFYFYHLDWEDFWDVSNYSFLIRDVKNKIPTSEKLWFDNSILVKFFSYPTWEDEKFCLHFYARVIEKIVGEEKMNDMSEHPEKYSHKSGYRDNPK